MHTYFKNICSTWFSSNKRDCLGPVTKKYTNKVAQLWKIQYFDPMVQMNIVNS